MQQSLQPKQPSTAYSQVGVIINRLVMVKQEIQHVHVKCNKSSNQKMWQLQRIAT